MEKYIIIFENGKHFITLQITENELDLFKSGVISIIRTSDLKELNSYGEWIHLNIWSDN